MQVKPFRMYEGPTGLHIVYHDALKQIIEDITMSEEECELFAEHLLFYGQYFGFEIDCKFDLGLKWWRPSACSPKDMQIRVVFHDSRPTRIDDFDLVFIPVDMNKTGVKVNVPVCRPNSPRILETRA